MFDIAPSELMIVLVVAVVLIGPKDLPRVMTFVGYWVGKGRALMRQFRGVVDDMMREAQVHELQRKQAEEVRASAGQPEPEVAPPPPAAPAVVRIEEPELAL